jgi:aspartyl-tRNA(Asn)/glutamyl-tRNA(Gln) amidotransferase subunit A
MVQFFTIAEAAKLIRAKVLSPLELTEMCLDRIRRLDDKINAFITLTEETALDSARMAEREIMARGPRTPLHGIPIGLKDNFKTKGIATTGHSRQLTEYIPTEDSTAGRKLANAGTVHIGKLTLHEFAFAGPSFDLPWPPARNPWNPEHFTAGSSSGAAAAIASGMILGALGSDTGGSIRGPSALCGIAGLKPTYGRVSRYGVLPTAFSMDHVGPMAWTVEDCAILLQTLAGPDALDPTCSDRPVPNYNADLGNGVKGMKIGVVRHFFETDGPVNGTSLLAIENALDTFRRLGAELRTVTLSPLIDWKSAGYLIMLSEAYSVHEPWLRTQPEKYGELIRDQLSLGALVSAADYLQAQRRRRELIAEMDEATADIDILVCAVQSGEAPRIDAVPKWRSVEAPSHTIPFSLTGYPALSICCGYGNGGLPLAIQLISRPFEEVKLLRAGHTYEQATTWRTQRPPMAISA